MKYRLQIRRLILSTCQVHVLHGFVRGFEFWIVYQFPPKPATDEQFSWSTCHITFFCNSVTELCSGMTPLYHRATLNKTVFESKRFRAKFLLLQTMTRRRRTSQGVLDTTTVHHQANRNLSCFCLPVLQIKLRQLISNQAAPTDLHLTQAYVDNFVIAICLQMAILPHVSDDSSAQL